MRGSTHSDFQKHLQFAQQTNRLRLVLHLVNSINEFAGAALLQRTEGWNFRKFLFGIRN
jgi:hypothetical protein